MTTGARSPSVPLVAAVDVVLVVVFAAIGRASHAEGNPVVGALGTALPFLVGLALGWAIVRVRSGAWPVSVGRGVTVWACTLVGGMLVRLLTGQGAAPSFWVVAGTVLAAFLLGSRWLRTRLNPS